MNRELQAELLEQIFQTYEDIEAVYLFGSAASGRLHPDSDLDLAIVPRDPALVARRLDILTRSGARGLLRCGPGFPDG